MKKLLTLITVAVMLLGIIPAYAQGGTDVKYNNSNIVYSGRWYRKPGGMHSGWQSTCKITFTGTSLTVNGEGNVFVQIDDAEPVDFTLSDNIVVAEGLAQGEHTAIFMPQKYNDKMVFKGFFLDKDAKTVPSKWVPTVECIGDSLTSGGYQNDKGSPFLVKLGYPYHLGKKLGWNVYSIGQSGIPLCENERNGEGNSMSVKYDYWSLRAEDKVNKDKALEKHPDYIILKLGANDWYQYVSKEKWIQTNKDFITHLRQKHPGVVIFVISPFSFPRVEDTKAAVDYFNSEDVVFVDPTDWGYQQYRISDNCHFGEEGNVFIADKMYDIIMNYVSTHPTPIATATPQPTAEPTQTTKPTQETTTEPTSENQLSATQIPENSENDKDGAKELSFIIGGAATVAAAGGAVAVALKKKKDKKDD